MADDVHTTDNPVHDDVHTMAMVKTKGKPARERWRAVSATMARRRTHCLFMAERLLKLLQDERKRRAGARL